MTAYHFNIKSTSLSNTDDHKNDPSLKTLLIQESEHVDLNTMFYAKLDFMNNQGRDLTLYSDREMARTVKGQLWAFEIKDVMTFYWHSASKTLKYVKHDNFSEALMQYWYLQTVIPLYLTIEETYRFLHAGAVEIEGKPVLFIAESFGGKSTMTDYFIQHGHKMLSDDKVGVYEKDGSIFAVPSHPYHRPYRAEEDLGYLLDSIVQTPAPIHAIYQLKRVEANADIKIEPLTGLEKLKALRFSGQMNLFFLKVKHFALLGKLAETVPVFQVTVPWDLTRLEEVHHCIVRHSKTKISTKQL